MGTSTTTSTTTTDTHNGSSYGIPGHWPPSALRGKPGTKVVPNENFCTQHRGCKVSFLVLLDEAPQGQEGERRDRQLERYPREAPNGGQELRYLDPIRFSLWYPQHVQGVPRKVKNFGIWIRYDSRSGTHNMYKEYREMSR